MSFKRKCLTFAEIKRLKKKLGIKYPILTAFKCPAKKRRRK